MTISKRFAGTSAAALLIAAVFVTVSAPSSFAADRGIAVVGKKKAAKFTFEEKVSAENDVVVEPTKKKKKNFKFLVKEDKPEVVSKKPVFEQADKNESKKIEFVVQDDKPAKKVKKTPKSNLIILAEDKPEGSKRKPRIAQEDKIDNTLEIADLGGATRDDVEIADGTEEAPIKKVKITGKKKPVVEDTDTEETEEKATTDETADEKEVVEEPEAEEKPVVKKKKVAKKTKKVIEDDYEDSYGEYEDSYGESDDSYSYNQSYGVSYGGGYSSCH